MGNDSDSFRGLPVLGEKRTPGTAVDECPADPLLLAEGWEKRNLVDPNRLSEISDLYRELGYEVRAEPVGKINVSPKCGECGEEVCRSLLIVYTRKP